MIQSVMEYDDLAQSMSWDNNYPAVVLREGQLREVKTRELIPGDVVHLSEVCHRQHLVGEDLLIDWFRGTWFPQTVVSTCPKGL